MEWLTSRTKAGQGPRVPPRAARRTRVLRLVSSGQVRGESESGRGTSRGQAGGSETARGNKIVGDEGLRLRAFILRAHAVTYRPYSIYNAELSIWPAALLHYCLLLERRLLFHAQNGVTKSLEGFFFLIGKF